LMDPETHEITTTFDLMEWAAIHHDFDKKVVALDGIEEITVSTVFLGLDHSFGVGPPVLFETMVFGLQGEYQDEHYQERYCTYEEAIEGHKKVLQAVLDLWKSTH
jgi:hypothetical protein